MHVTNIMLLFDPEHITAANYRKRYLLHLGQEHDQDAVKQELWYLNSILTSPLHRQSKSPTLWHHRYWLFENFLLPVHSPKETKYQALLETILSEVQAICKAGERHPNNYYAWEYGHKLIQIVQKLPVAAETNPTDELLARCTRTVQDWCLRHPADTSGWSFLLFLLEQPEQVEHTKVDVVTKVLGLTLDFRWQQEGLWVFLRTVLASNLLPEEARTDCIQRIQEADQPEKPKKNMDGHDQEQESVIAHALRWIKRNSAAG